MSAQFDFVGQIFGNYKLNSLIDSGGHARVYFGEHAYLHTQVAVKVLKTANVTSIISPEEQVKFINEAQILTELKHPHIIKIIDFGIKDELEGVKCSIPFIVMTYAQRGSLRKANPYGTRMPLDKIASYITQVADALQYAHDFQVKNGNGQQMKPTVHLDVKPENMLIMAPDDIVLADFGIAVANHKTSEFPISQGGNQQSVKVFGSVGYMAKERFYGAPSRASDQYALAVVAYEWLTGYRPFSGTEGEVMAQHINTPPPTMRGRFPDISEELETVVMKGLAKEPAQRYPTVKDFADALVQAIQNILHASYTTEPTTVGASPQQQAGGINQQQYASPHQWQNAGAAPTPPPPTPPTPAGGGGNQWQNAGAAQTPPQPTPPPPSSAGGGGGNQWQGAGAAQTPPRPMSPTTPPPSPTGSGGNQWQGAGAAQTPPNPQSPPPPPPSGGGANQQQYAWGAASPSPQSPPPPPPPGGSANQWQNLGGASNQGGWGNQGQGPMHLPPLNPTGPILPGNTTFGMNPLGTNTQSRQRAQANQHAPQGFQQFKRMFDFVPDGIKEQLRTSYDFLTIPEYFWYRVMNYILIILCAAGLTIDVWRYVSFVPLLLPFIMIPIFRWFVRLVKPNWAKVIGFIISIYYGLCVWAIVDIFSLLKPISATIPILEFLSSSFVVIVSFLINRNYVDHRLPNRSTTRRR